MTDRQTRKVKIRVAKAERSRTNNSERLNRTKIVIVTGSKLASVLKRKQQIKNNMYIVVMCPLVFLNRYDVDIDILT